MATQNPDCCAPFIGCLDCPIIVSCVGNLNLAPGQIQYCPDTGAYTYAWGGNTYYLNPLLGNGLWQNGRYMSVKIAPNRPIIFNSQGALDIDCAKLIACCSLVNQQQFAITIDNLYTWITNHLPTLMPKDCAGTPVSSTT